VALHDDLATAYQRALECDERSAFGGIVALNRPVDAATAERMVAGPQADLVIAPGWEPGTIDALIAKRKNTRLLEAGPPEAAGLDFRQISGGFLVQDPHHFAAMRDDWRVVTKRAPTESEWRDAELAWRICGHVKSNAIVLVKDGQAVGIGAGQQNRVESGEIAAKKAAGRARGGAGASDAFYPFPDGIEAAAEAGVAVIVQPGGAMRDEPNIERADELGLAMVFTGERHFLH
jgi:phosphoribosylaminoimidazolecarboxamide formyltransferase/IMP cyclohydrolase